MIKNIIFDLGNVIVQNPNIDLVKHFFKEEKDAIAFNEYIFKSEFWKDMDLGKITNLEIANRIREQKLINVNDYYDDTNRTIEAANSIGIKCRRVQPNNPDDVKQLLSENEIMV